MMMEREIRLVMSISYTETIWLIPMWYIILPFLSWQVPLLYNEDIWHIFILMTHMAHTCIIHWWQVTFSGSFTYSVVGPIRSVDNICSVAPFFPVWCKIWIRLFSCNRFLTCRTYSSKHLWLGSLEMSLLGQSLKEKYPPWLVVMSTMTGIQEPDVYRLTIVPVANLP